MKRSPTRNSTINIILDLDNTLLYSFDLFNPEPHEKIPRFVHQNVVRSYELKNNDGEPEFLVTERPHLQEFLKWLFRNFTVSIWSAGSPEYVKFIVNECIRPSKTRKLKNVYDSKLCKRSNEKFNTVKDLRMLYSKRGQHYNSSNTLIIDDLQEVIKANPDNSIKIPKYTAKPYEYKDTGLLSVKEKLKNIRKNFKKFNKIIL